MKYRFDEISAAVLAIALSCAVLSMFLLVVAGVF